MITGRTSCSAEMNVQFEARADGSGRTIGEEEMGKEGQKHCSGNHKIHWQMFHQSDHVMCCPP